jgi:pimeloyl-ACP methyl ester carboxylesterase
MREGVVSMPIIRVNGAALYYEEHGTGPETIVFAHGLLWSCRMFDAQVALLKDRYLGSLS